MTTDQSWQLVRRYLLGDLKGSDQENCEEKFMTGEASLAEIEAAEDDLLDEYLAGRLTENERVQFEQHFLSTPARKQKLRFAKVFHRYVASHQPAAAAAADSRIPPGLFNLQTWSARIAIVVLFSVMAGVWFYLRSRNETPNYAIVTLILSPSTRAAGAHDTTVTLPDSGDPLRAVLLLPEDGRETNYRVEVESDTGEAIPSRIVEQKPESLMIELQGSQLQRRQYVVKLFEVSDQRIERRISGNYFFTVK